MTITTLDAPKRPGWRGGRRNSRGKPSHNMMNWSGTSKRPGTRWLNMDHTAGRCSTDVKTHHHIHPASHLLTWIVTGDNESSRISTFHRDIINRTIIRKSGHNSFRNKTPTYNNLIKTRNELWMNLEKKIYRNHIFLLTKKRTHKTTPESQTYTFSP